MSGGFFSLSRLLGRKNKNEKTCKNNKKYIFVIIKIFLKDILKLKVIPNYCVFYSI